MSLSSFWKNAADNRIIRVMDNIGFLLGGEVLIVPIRLVVNDRELKEVFGKEQ